MVSSFFNIKKSTILMALSLFLVLIPFLGFAADYADVSMEEALCNAYGLFNGPIGKAFAIFAIVALGVLFFLGKVNWGTAIAIALGIGAIFGAPALVGMLTGTSDTKCISTSTGGGTGGGSV